MFFSLKPPHPKGIHPSKFQLAGVCRFGGVREQTNKKTDSLTDWCFDREMAGPLYISIYYDNSIYNYTMKTLY